MTIWNNVEYIKQLEEGTSKQAPQGMVAVTVRELESQTNIGTLNLDFKIT